MSTPIEAPVGVELSHLTKMFGKTAGVNDLTLSLPRGQTLGFIGPNGAGKTTTIKMMLGLLPITSGRASVLGVDVARDSVQVRRRTGYVPEETLISRWMTVDEVVHFCRSHYPTWNDALCGKLLGRFRLPFDRKVKHLSKGMLAKLSLLLAIAHEPEVLILDEPTAGLDPVAREEFLEGVLETAPEHGQTVLFSSHMHSDVERMADAVAIIYDGRLLVHCSLDQLLARTKRVRLLVNDGHPAPQALKGVICQRRQRQECLMTVADYEPAWLERLSELGHVKVIEVLDMGLEEVFKDYVIGQRAGR